MCFHMKHQSWIEIPYSVIVCAARDWLLDCLGLREDDRETPTKQLQRIRNRMSHPITSTLALTLHTPFSTPVINLNNQ